MTLLSHPDFRILLIGGSSHTGKSTLARAIAKPRGWSYLSTDSLARHPGRPWKENPAEIPSHVREHYAALAVEDLFTDVLAHYQRVWGTVGTILSNHLQDTAASPLVIEGSALWPGFVARWRGEHPGLKADVQALWLTASEETFKQRIFTESKITTKLSPEQHLIEKFLARTIYFNQKMIAAVRDLGLASVSIDSADLAEDPTPEALAQQCLVLLKD